MGSWQLQFKSRSIVIVDFQNFVCSLTWAVDLGVQIADDGRSLYIVSFWPAMIALSRYLEEAAFSILVTSTPTKPVENVVLTTKDLQDRNNSC